MNAITVFALLSLGKNPSLILKEDSQHFLQEGDALRKVRHHVDIFFEVDDLPQK